MAPSAGEPEAAGVITYKLSVKGNPESTLPDHHYFVSDGLQGACLLAAYQVKFGMTP